jgi:hypothetical protein
LQAVLLAGGNVVPINTRYTAVEAGDLVARADSLLVIVEGECRIATLPKKRLSLGNSLFCRSGAG